jgi:transposase-like protein
MGKQDKKRRMHTKEFKAEAVALAWKHEKPVHQIALDLGIKENTRSTCGYRVVGEKRCLPNNSL